MAEAPGAGSAGGQQETRDGPHLRPSFLLSERPPIAGGDGKDAGCQADTPPSSRQQLFRRSGSGRAAIVRACSSISTLAIPTVVQPTLSLSSIISRATQALRTPLTCAWKPETAALAQQVGATPRRAIERQS
jgi:hypothetical protein